jgi:GT2 family glycosyltransferase
LSKDQAAMLYTILVNWNGWADTIACISSLLEADHDALTIVVCDNASRDASVAQITQWADVTLRRAEPPLPRPELSRARARLEWIAPDRPSFRFVLLENRDNYGFAGGNNVGITLALADPSCRYVFVLNNDTEVALDALRRLEAKADADPSLAVVGATLVFHDRPDTVQGLGARYDRRRARAKTLFAGGALAALPPVEAVEREMEYAIGAAMFMRADVLRREGGLSEDYFLYYEELDFSQRLLPDERLGWARDAVIRHKVGGSIGTGRVKMRASNTSIYYDHRSKIRFYRTYWPHLTFFLLARIGKTVLAYLRKGDWTAVRVILQAVSDYRSKPKEYRADLSRFERNNRR